MPVRYEFKNLDKIQEFLKDAATIKKVGSTDWREAVGKALKRSIIEGNVKGKDVNGNPHKGYSRKPRYMYTTKTAQKEAGQKHLYKPAPSQGRKFKNGNRRKMKYYPGGYAQYKAEVSGKSTVNIRNTGLLFKEIRIKLIKNGVRLFIGRRQQSNVVGAAIKKEGRNWFGFGKQVRKDVAKLLRSALGFSRSK